MTIDLRTSSSTDPEAGLPHYHALHPARDGVAHGRMQEASSAVRPPGLRHPDADEHLGIADKAGPKEDSAAQGEHADAPVKAGAPPFERLGTHDYRINITGLDMALWYDPAIFSDEGLRFSVAEEGPGSVLTIGGEPGNIQQATLDGVPVKPGDRYLLESGMRLKSPVPVDVQIRTVKPRDRYPTPLGPG